MRKRADSETSEADIRRNTVLKMMWIDEMPPREIARRLGVPIEDIYQLLREAEQAIVAKARS